MQWSSIPIPNRALRTLPETTPTATPVLSKPSGTTQRRRQHFRISKMKSGGKAGTKFPRPSTLDLQLTDNRGMM
jgi:hypothetical protein